MPFADPRPEPGVFAAFVDLCGCDPWSKRLDEIGRQGKRASWGGRAAQQRHALELALGRLGDPGALDGARLAERRVAAFACEAVRLAAELPPGPRARFRTRLAACLEGESTLVPLFHLLRVAALHRARGYAVTHAGLADEAPFDLLIERDGVEAEIACETVSAEEGRPVLRGDWCALMDRVNPELQTWLAAHPGRYLLKMTLPEGINGPDQVAELHRRISQLLQEDRRQDASAAAVLRLDPLMLAGAQLAPSGLPATLRAQFGPDAHLAVTTAGGEAGGSAFVMAARAGRENGIADAVCRRLRAAAATRLTGDRPGILAVFLDDLDRAEWRGLRDRLELEGAVRRFLTEPPARVLVAVTCASRLELLGCPPPDGAPEGELRFRNQAHPAAKLPALAAATLSSG